MYYKHLGLFASNLVPDSTGRWKMSFQAVMQRRVKMQFTKNARKNALLTGLSIAWGAKNPLRGVKLNNAKNSNVP